MLQAPSIRKELLDALSNKILPALLSAEGVPMLLAAPPFSVPAEMIVRHLPVPLLPDGASGKGEQWRACWDEAKINSTGCPYFSFVFEGEADLKLGTTVSMVRQSNAQQQDDEWIRCGLHVLQVRAPGFIFYPPGIPHSDGSMPHWDRDSPSQRTKILSVHLLPNRVLCHTCISEGTSHTTRHSLIVNDPQFLGLARTLEEEMRVRSVHHERIAYCLLQTLFLRLHRRLALDEAVIANTAWPTALSSGPDSPDAPGTEQPAVVEKAGAYVQEHLSENISPVQVADHCRLSCRQLNRIFRASLGLTVKEYVLQQKVQAARRMLMDKESSIKEISALLGFSHSSHFCTLFQRLTNMTPGQYRKSAPPALE